MTVEKKSATMPSAVHASPTLNAGNTAPASAWAVYLLHCADGTLYTGITTDLCRRVAQHNGEQAGGARYTRARRPVVLVWSEPCANRSAAARAEYRVRSLPRPAKARLAGLS